MKNNINTNKNIADEQNSNSCIVLDNQDLYNAFYDNNFDYYQERQERIQSGEKVIFSWYAFFLGLFWISYRKMYKEALILFVGIIVIDIIFSLMLPEGSALNSFINLGINIAVGCYANYFYIMKAEKTVEDAKSMYSAEGDQLQYVESKGGTNGWAPVIVGVCSIVIVIMSFVFGDFISSVL